MTSEYFMSIMESFSTFRSHMFKTPLPFGTLFPAGRPTRKAYPQTTLSSSTNFCSRSLWFNPSCFSMT